MAPACNPRVSKVDRGASGGQGHIQLYSEFEASLGYMRPCLKTEKPQTNKRTNSNQVGKQSQNLSLIAFP